MEVGIGVIWEIIVDSQVDTFNINTTPKNISGNTDTLVELFKFLVALDTVDMSVLSNRRYLVLITVPPD